MKTKDLRKLKHTISLSLIGLSQFFSHSTQAQVNDSHVVSGPLTMESYDRFMSALNANKINTVVFKDCDGGNALAGFKIAAAIKNNGIHTIASGRVISACSIAYLGGLSRKIDTTGKNNATLIQFHGASDAQTGKSVGKTKNQEVLDILNSVINFRFKKTVEDIILNTKSSDEGIIFLRSQSGDETRDVTLYCPSGVDMKPEKCKKLDGITLESEGIVTK
jgi:hypothetical protein